MKPERLSVETHEIGTEWAAILFDAHGLEVWDADGLESQAAALAAAEAVCAKVGAKMNITGEQGG